MTSQAALSDAHRDALAFIVAAARGDEEGMSAIQAAASPAGLAGTLSACVVHLAERAGLDAGEWAAGELAAAVAELSALWLLGTRPNPSSFSCRAARPITWSWALCVTARTQP